jgi:uncharacterized protein (TIGR03435 family)
MKWRPAHKRLVPAQLKTLAVLSLSLALASSSPAQTKTPAKPAPAQPSRKPLPRFEGATIKPVNPHNAIEVGTDVQPGGRIRLNGMHLTQMVAVAFNLSDWQIEGGDFMDRDQYNLVAQPPAAMRATMPDTRHTAFGIQDARLRLMLQALLTERFHLRVHRETKPGKVFLLKTSGKTLQLQTTRAVTDDPDDQGAAPASFGSIAFAGKWVLYNTTMPQLAKFASDNMMRAPVLDRTRLTGSFDYWGPPEDWTTYQQDHPASFLNMLRDIGLQLVPAKGPVETLVIDHAEPPSSDGPAGAILP